MFSYKVYIGTEVIDSHMYMYLNGHTVWVAAQLVAVMYMCMYAFVYLEYISSAQDTMFMIEWSD